MNKIFAMLVVSAFATTTLANDHEKNSAAENLYSFTVKDIDGKAVDLKKFEGKILLVVNTASECGYTKQYGPLEDLYRRFKDKGFVILGFPSNDFGGQEPGSEKEIKAFCQTKFNVTFPMFSKVKVKGDNKADLYKWLTQSQEVKWNFEKFLVDKKGKVIARYPSKTEPLGKELTQAIEKVL